MYDEEVLSEIRERMVRVETKIDAMTDVRGVAEYARETAQEALQLAKAAQYRAEEVADNQRWLWRTVVGAIVAAVIAAIVQFQGGGQ